MWRQHVNVLASQPLHSNQSHTTGMYQPTNVHHKHFTVFFLRKTYLKAEKLDRVTFHNHNIFHSTEDTHFYELLQCSLRQFSDQLHMFGFLATDFF